MHLDDFNVKAEYLKEVLDRVHTTTKVEWHKLSDRFLVSGTFQQVTHARDLLRQHLAGSRSCQKVREDSKISAAPRSTRCPDISSETITSLPQDSHTARKKPEKYDINTYEVAPHIVNLIYHAYKDEIQELRKFIFLRLAEDKKSITLKPTENCDVTTYNKVCDNFIDLYQRVFTRTSQEQLSINRQTEVSKSELMSVVHETMQKFRIWIEDEHNPSVLKIYGRDSEIKAAKKMLIGLLRLESEKDLRRRRRVIKEPIKDLMAESSNVGELKGERESIEHTTVTGVKITLCKGDITLETVDVIVNGVDWRLENKMDLAKDVVDREGIGKATNAPLPSEKVVFTHSDTHPGPCKATMNAVVPEWVQEDELNIKRQLHKIVKECIILASGHSMKSIALPSFTFRPFELPPEVSAQVELRAIKSWSKNVGPMYHGIRDIRVIVPDDSTFETYKCEFVKLFPMSKNKLDKEVQKAKSSQEARKTSAETVESVEELKRLDNIRDVSQSHKEIPSDGWAGTPEAKVISKSTNTVISEDTKDAHSAANTEVFSEVKYPTPTESTGQNQFQKETTVMLRDHEHSLAEDKEQRPKYLQYNGTNVSARFIKETDAMKPLSAESERNIQEVTKSLADDIAFNAKVSKTVEPGVVDESLAKPVKAKGETENLDTNHNYTGLIKKDKIVKDSVIEQQFSLLRATKSESEQGARGSHPVLPLAYTANSERVLAENEDTSSCALDVPSVFKSPSHLPNTENLLQKSKVCDLFEDSKDEERYSEINMHATEANKKGEEKDKEGKEEGKEKDAIEQENQQQEKQKQHSQQARGEKRGDQQQQQ